ncbi:MAG TPA: PilC/PilY family type IV pilus protein [Thermoanaerobaculia bacterium]|nr:PilC/PilY family type IV pilus protein [Thermoanaerobaculia bacterium]
MIANWLAPAVRGIFAMAPPPPPDGPCPGIPASYTGGGKVLCGPCLWQSIVPPPFQDFNKPKLCAYYDVNGNGQFDPGIDYAPMGEPNYVINPANGVNPLPSAPFTRGFDDPQADPDPTLLLTSNRGILVKYSRADLYDLPPLYLPNDSSNGNPPWGSCPTAIASCPAAPDNDADGAADSGTIPDRHNQGMYSSSYNNNPAKGFEPNRPVQQYPNDALAGPSCPLRALGTCDPYAQDCGGFAHFNAFTTVEGTSFQGAAPNLLLNPPSGPNPHVYPSDPPAAPESWPVVPFKRDWISTDYPGGASPDSSIKRLLRFTSSIVSYNSAAPGPDTAYTLEEDAKEIVVTSIGTPVAGVLRDAYNYFVNGVFPPASNYPWTGSGSPPAPDPSIDCRKYIVVYITDGKDECGADNAICTGGTISGNGPAGDMGQVLLPESAPGRRAAAALLDPDVKTKGIPVFVVAMTTDVTFQATLQCIADLSGGQYFQATDRSTLASQLQFILDFKRSANFFASPSVPAFAGGVGDTAQIGAVVPSHLNPNGDLSAWSIWSGSLKSFQLDTNGQIPVVTAAAPTPPPTDTPGGPTATPVVGTPTPTPSAPTGQFADETDPDDANPLLRKPVWNAGRVLGFTDPKADLTAGAAPTAANPSGRAPAISVWPGRKMIFADGVSGVPLTRADFMPNSGTCTGAGTPGSCFDDLMNYMGLLPTSSTANQTRAVLTVQFLRGGISAFGSRDEVLNDPSVRPSSIGPIGPNTGQEQKYSYFYQDDAPAPGAPPQVRTDDDGNPPAGYSHKLGDIFHSEPTLVEPPRYFQYLSANLTPRTSSSTSGEPYLNFASRNAKRRKVLFVGANDGFMHAFDSGVYGRDTTNFPAAFDLGTGREIFAYSPKLVMTNKFPNLLNFQPSPQYFVDGSATAADVFIDPSFGASPTATDRAWRTVLVGGLRQGGNGYFALDITQPDDIDLSTVSPTFGEIVGNKDASPMCLDGAGTSCVAGASPNRKYPEVMWEMTDAGAACSDSCATVPAPIGETWSRPVVGRIKVHDPLSPTADSSGFDDRYVAIVGGGFDPNFTAGDSVATRLPRGRALYMIDVETGKILYKVTEGVDAGGAKVNFAPMPAPPAVADFNDDGYLDVVYIGDVNGNMWRINLTPDGVSVGEIMADGQAHGYQPFLLFDGCEATAGVCTQHQPIFYEPGIVFLGGGGASPGLGIAWGTGNRAELAKANVDTAGFFYVNDGGSTATTFLRADLHDLTPPAGGPCTLPYTGSCANAVNGFRLDFSSLNEKTTSTVFSTQGYLSLITFTPDSVSPCATNGSSFRYRFFYLTGQGAYSGTGYGAYQQSLGTGVATATQSTSPLGDIIDTVLFSGGGLRQDDTPGSARTIEQNWKEQQ